MRRVMMWRRMRDRMVGGWRRLSHVAVVRWRRFGDWVVVRADRLLEHQVVRFDRFKAWRARFEARLDDAAAGSLRRWLRYVGLALADLITCS